MAPRTLAPLVPLIIVLAVGCRRQAGDNRLPGHELAGPLVSAKTTMMSAWDVPKNPLIDPSVAQSPIAEQIRWGYRIFTDTPHQAKRFTHSRMSCSNCHLNNGQRERALPIVAVAGMFPEFNRRAGRLFTLADRIVDCFLRSENGAAPSTVDDDPLPVGAAAAGDDEAAVPTPTSNEVLAVSAYITWLADGYPVGKNPSWRGRNTIDSKKLILVDTLDPKTGEAIFTERCVTCHGADGQGVQIGDKKAGPLWGPDSWNDGAGAARVYTLAGIVRYAMPYLDPGSLTDEEAQQVAAYITSKPRPRFPDKDRDYPGAKPPADAVYYRR